MLSFIRSHAASWIVKILFLFLILSFAAWGIGDIFRLQSQGSETVATVGDAEIGRQALVRQFDAQIRQLQPLFNNRLDREQAVEMGLLDQALNQLVNTQLIDQEAAALEVMATDDAVRREIQSEPGFKNAEGKFDRARFEGLLASNGLTEEGYVALIRQNLSEGQVIGAVTSGVVVPDVMVETLYRSRNERRVAEAAVVPIDAAAEPPAPDEAALRDWYEKHKDRFQAPEYRAITAVLMTPETLAQGIQIPEEELKAEFEQRKAQLGKPEKRDLAQVVAGDEAVARKIVELAQAGTDLAAAAQQAAAPAPVELGLIEKGQLPPPVAEAAFATAEGQVTQPVKSALGWHVVKVKRIEPGVTPVYEEAKEQLRQDLALRQAADRIAELANQFEDALAGGATLEEAAKQVGFEARRIEALDPAGKDPAGAAVPGLPQTPEFLGTAFSTEAGQSSPLGELGNGGYYMVRVDGVTPAQPRPFEQAREQVLVEWQAEQRRAAAEQAAKALADKVTGGGDFAALATEAGATLKPSKPLLRSEADDGAGVPATATARLFTMKPGEVAVEPIQNGFAVLRLKEIVPAVPSSDPDGLKALKAELERQMQNELAGQYQNALRKRHPVEIDRETLQNLY